MTMKKAVRKTAAVKKKVSQKKAPAVKTAKKSTVRKQERKQEEPRESWFGLHSIPQPAGAHKRRKLLGRGSGSGHGKTSTRGSKGQTSRAGRDFYPGFEGGQTPLIRRMPKRGFTGGFKKVYQIVNLKQLEKVTEETITPAILQAAGLIKDRTRRVKILGEGRLSKAHVVQAHAFSQKADAAIKEAGGKTEIIDA